MKANESIPNFDIKVREYTNYAIKSIKNVCKNFGSRVVGSEGDLKSQEYVKADMEKWCDTVEKQDFTCRPTAITKAVPFCAGLMLLSTILFTLGVNIAVLILSVITLVTALNRFLFLNTGLFGLLTKKVNSSNYYGVVKSKGETKKRIILSGHLDSAYESTYLKKGGFKLQMFVVAGCLVSVLLNILGSVYAMIYYNSVMGEIVWSKGSNPVLMVLAVLTYITVPVLIMAIKFTDFKNAVMGANDDLTGTFSALAVAKFLTDNNIHFDNTEVAVLVTNGEEAGLCGSKAFVNANKEKLTENGVETIFISLDTIHDLDFAAAYNKDLNGIVKNDERVADLIVEGAKIAGRNIKKESIGFGATDSAAFSKGKIPAATFSAMDSKNAKYYHTTEDKPENLSPQAIDAGVKTALETVFLYDEKGI